MKIKYFLNIVILLVLAIIFSQNVLLSKDNEIKILESEVEQSIKEKNFKHPFADKVFHIAYYYHQSDPLKGINYVKKILTIPELHSDDFTLSVIYNRYANLYSELEKNDIAVKYLSEAISISKKINDFGSYYWMSVDLGNIFFKVRNYEKAIENYKIAAYGFPKISIQDQKSIYHAIAVANENIGLSYSNLSHFDSAMYYIRIAQKYRYLSKNNLGIKIINYNLGKFFFANKQYDSSYINIMKSLDMTDFIMDKPGINFEYAKYHIKALYILSNLYNELGKNDSANFYFKKATSFMDEQLTLSPRLSLLTQTAKIFYEGKRYDLGLELALKAYKLILDSSMMVFLPPINKILSDIYYNMGDYKKAIQFRREYDIFNDSTFIFSQNKLLVMELDASELDSKIKEIKQQNKIKEEEVHYLYNISLILLIFIAVIISFVYIFYKLNRDKKKLNNTLAQKNEELNQTNESLTDSQIEIQQANEELLALNDQLRSTNFELEESNNTKNKLFSIIAHDLRNSIGSGVNLIDLLNTSYDELTNEERREYVDLIAQSSNKVYRLLENLLTWSSTLRGNVKPNLDLNNLYRVAQNSVELYEQKANEKSIKIINNIKNDIEINFDASLIDTVIRNILNNAVKYSLPDGHIYLDAKVENGSVLISIRDEGIGMPPEKAAGIFKSQFNKSTEGTFGEKGTGLGLMICYEFVKLHNGDIWFESEINKGTICFIKIPFHN